MCHSVTFASCADSSTRRAIYTENEKRHPTVGEPTATGFDNSKQMVMIDARLNHRGLRQGDEEMEVVREPGEEGG